MFLDAHILGLATLSSTHHQIAPSVQKSIPRSVLSWVKGNYFGNVDMEVADGILPELAFRGLVAFDLEQPADAMAVETTTQRRAGRLRSGGLERVKTIAERQQSLPAKSAGHRFLHLATVFALIP
jgi:hypothetical protein